MMVMYDTVLSRPAHPLKGNPSYPAPSPIFVDILLSICFCSNLQYGTFSMSHDPTVAGVGGFHFS
jgi:hypothetical protein